MINRLGSKLKPIVITPGEPAGIGPDIVIKALKKFNYPFIIIADPDLIAQRADQLNIKIDKKIFAQNILSVSQQSKKYVLECLDTAVDLCMRKRAKALLTGPVNKAKINQVGFPFLGHTHYLAKKTKTKNVVMFFENPVMKLALVTDHIPLASVSKAITSQKLMNVFTIVHHQLRNLYKLKNPRIAVCGLNPHAGEKGFLGSEEINVITPAIQACRKQKINITGPYSADSLFNINTLKNFDVVVAMYHDQGLCVLKHCYFGKSVNITLGLPFLRTSVDHGTAEELAGTGKANANSLIYAFAKTVQLI
jgi:4-hydroxythreonine-4-phosphate dehydrogenase